MTTNLTKRVRAHNGEIRGGAKYTRSRRPVQLIFALPFDSRSSACKAEYRFKKLSRKEKENLMSNVTMRKKDMLLADVLPVALECGYVEEKVRQLNYGELWALWDEMTPGAIPPSGVPRLAELSHRSMKAKLS